jgi:crotonobetainyl-CoA:carnitine CoA-transferase CaiB-like acyl-CoA transferase
VLDFTIALAGPYCSSLLGDLGAEVIKVENVVSTDRKGPAAIEGIGCFFGNANEGKKSVTINMKTPEGKELFTRWCWGSEVMVKTSAPAR